LVAYLPGGQEVAGSNPVGPTIFFKKFQRILQGLKLYFIITKTILSAIIISLLSWLAQRKTSLAGYLTALPLTTLLVLAFTQFEGKNSQLTAQYAKDILLALPFSTLFFLPFFFMEKFHLSFWSCYTIGIILLFLGHLIYSSLSRFI
jgi:hypothetical protein